MAHLAGFHIRNPGPVQPPHPDLINLTAPDFGLDANGSANLQFTQWALLSEAAENKRQEQTRNLELLRDAQSQALPCGNTTCWCAQGGAFTTGTGRPRPHHVFPPARPRVSHGGHHHRHSEMPAVYPVHVSHNVTNEQGFLPAPINQANGGPPVHHSTVQVSGCGHYHHHHVHCGHHACNWPRNDSNQVMYWVGDDNRVQEIAKGAMVPHWTKIKKVYQDGTWEDFRPKGGMKERQACAAYHGISV